VRRANIVRLDWPQLQIHFSDELAFRLVCVTARKYEIGFDEYLFEVKCHVRHPSGYFEYFVDHLCFQPDDFTGFAAGLRAMQQGIASRAVLKNVGDMLLLQLELSGRKLRLTVKIREYMPPHGSADLSLSTDADYDLFVNKLVLTVEEFVKNLRSVEPEKLA
jgi:hypothetical protein